MFLEVQVLLRRGVLEIGASWHLRGLGVLASLGFWFNRKIPRLQQSFAVTKLKDPRKVITKLATLMKSDYGGQWQVVKRLLVIPNLIFQMWCLFGVACGFWFWERNNRNSAVIRRVARQTIFFCDEFILSVCCRPVFVASLFLRQPVLQVLHDKRSISFLLKLVDSIFINSSE